MKDKRGGEDDSFGLGVDCGDEAELQAVPACCLRQLKKRPNCDISAPTYSC
jgi:hypothetical protein